MKRNISFDLLRVICSLMVVMIHVAGSYWDCVGYNNDYFCAMTFYNGITRGAVPVFVMMSGMFMIPKNIPAKGLLKRILLLLACFYGWSFFYAFQGLAFKFITGKVITSQDIFNSCQRFVFGHYHQWFITLTIGLYLIIPFVKKICSEKNLMRYFIILWLFITFVPKVLHIEGLISKLQMNFVAEYVGYFILGYYLTQITIKRIYRIGIYILGIAAAAYTVLKTIIDTRVSGTFISSHFSPLTWNALFMAVAIFVLFQYEIKIHNTFISKIAKTTLFVYMLHPFFIEKLNLMGIIITKGNPWWTVPVMSIGIFIVSVIIALIAFKLLQIASNILRRRTNEKS